MLNIGHCENCIHFKKRVEWREGDPQISVDDMPDMGTCNNPKLRELEGCNNNVPDGLLYWDYEGYASGIYIGRLFGCIHFDERAPA